MHFQAKNYHFHCISKSKRTLLRCISKQKEATMEQYLEGDSANHSGNKVMDVQLWNPY